MGSNIHDNIDNIDTIQAITINSVFFPNLSVISANNGVREVVSIVLIEYILPAAI